MRTPAMLPWILALLFLLTTVGCEADDAAGTTPSADTALAADTAEPDAGGEDTQPEEPPGVVRFVHASDMHFYGTEEAPNREFLAERVAMLNELAPTPDLVVFTGDVVDYVPRAFDDPTVTGPLHLAVEGLDGLAAPWVASIGNHEFYETGEPFELTDDKAAREALFSAVMGRPLWDAVVVNGVRFVLLHSMDGPTWDENKALIGSFTPPQLDWLEETLADGRPSLLFFHHPPNTLAPDETGRTLCDVLRAHPDTVKGIFTGHLHTFAHSEVCGGVPSYVVDELRLDGRSYFEVEYDGVADTLTLLNEAELPFPEVPEIDCDPTAPPLAHPEAAVGGVQRLEVTNPTTDTTGLGQYLGDAIAELPMVLRVDAHDALAHTLVARLAAASRWGEVSGFLDYLPGAPCVPFDLRLDGPCVTAGPVSLEVDLVQFLDMLTETTPDPAWRARLAIHDFRIEGRMAEQDGVPVIEEAVLQARVEKAVTLADLRASLVYQYCADGIPGCTPGSADDLPACPATPDPALFDDLPSRCDFELEGLGVRALVGMIDSLPETVHVQAAAATHVVPTATEPTDGFVNEAVFATDPGMNCAE